MMDKQLEKLQEYLNRLFEKPEFQALLPRMPRYRYWQIKNDHYAFCYTTEPTSGKFYAMVYRITKKSWKIGRKVAFGRRKIAKARAYKWYRQRKEKLEQLPKVKEK